MPNHVTILFLRLPVTDTADPNLAGIWMDILFTPKRGCTIITFDRRHHCQEDELLSPFSDRRVSAITGLRMIVRKEDGSHLYLLDPSYFR
ncbi:hypothetical protein TNCV_2511841 [Trichonephila clavipes]|nr:hypothetical protein TNCV_2511841 [Trichonephila clavipes]